MADGPMSMTALLMCRYWIVPIDADRPGHHKIIMENAAIGAACDEVMKASGAQGALVYTIYPYSFFTPTQHADFQEGFDVYARPGPKPEEETD